MANPRVILLIGSTGSGKSTLANVLVNKNNNFEEIFKESESSSSVTKEIKGEKFEIDNDEYLVIDTVGIGDTKLTRDEVLDKIAEAVYLARDGVSRVFFIIDGRFNQFEIATYKLLKTIIFDESITEHTTIIRTKFDKFGVENE